MNKESESRSEETDRKKYLPLHQQLVTQLSSPTMDSEHFEFPALSETVTNVAMKVNILFFDAEIPKVLSSHFLLLGDVSSLGIQAIYAKQDGRMDRYDWQSYH